MIRDPESFGILLDTIERFVRERITGLGAQPVGGTPQEFRAFIRSEIAKWQKVIRDAGVKVE